MKRLIQPVIISALLVVIMMLYGVTRDLQRRIELLEARDLALHETAPITEIAKDLKALRGPRKPEPQKLGFRWIDLRDNPPTVESGMSVEKGMKADEMEMNRIKFEKVKRIDYPFSPDDELDGAKELLLR